MSGTIRIRKIGSIIGRPEKHRKVMESLGLRKMGQERVLPDNPAVRGMIKKVPHLVQVLEE
ncbi:MAG: 50S ribosomal protein L30 [Magnetococcales bacterium]|nr:50S ribosomal protein L30 [Magnetococcales bacterium]